MQRLPRDAQEICINMLTTIVPVSQSHSSTPRLSKESCPTKLEYITPRIS